METITKKYIWATYTMVLVFLVCGTLMFAKRESNPYVPSTNIVTRPINSTTFTPSTIRPAHIVYNVSISCTATIGSAASGDLALQYSTNGGSTWTTLGTAGNSNTVTLAVTLNSVQVSKLQLEGDIPANALVRMVQTTSGTTTISYLTGYELY